MRALPLIFATAAIGWATPITAQPMTQSEPAALAVAAQRGTLLYAYDRAAWLGTDAMLAKLPKPQGRIGGWIVDGPADAPELVFYDTDAANPHAVYVANFRRGKLASGTLLEGNDAPSLSPLRNRMIAARGVASAAIAASDARSCSGQPFNTVILPPSDPQGPVLVYFLTPQTRDAIALGGHFSIEVGADGRAGPIRRFAKSCIAMPLAAPKGGKAMAMVVSHLLDPIPTEIHVFTSLAAQKPVYVMIDERVWTVTGNRIDRPPAKPSAAPGSHRRRARLSAAAMNDPSTIRRLYGRAKGHKLRIGQAALIEERLPELSVPETGMIDAMTLFGEDRPLEFEIGFGAGEHLAGQAMLRPDHGFIGCEPFLNGVVGALNHIRDEGLENVRLHMGDALDVLERVPDASLTRLYLLHPDPWRKARHAKRRMVNDGPLDLIHAKLKPGGEFRLGTDDPTYCRWSMMVMNRRRDFEWQAKSAADFLIRPADWPETRYERKARKAGREVWYFRYTRL